MDQNNFGWHSQYNDETGYNPRQGGPRGGYRGRSRVKGWNTWKSPFYNQSEDGKAGHSKHSGQGRGRGRGGGGGGRGGRGRHPPGLKGREIGLWYASQNKTSTKEMTKAPTLSMDKQEAYTLNQAIDGLSNNIKTESHVSHKVERSIFQPSSLAASSNTNIDIEQILDEDMEKKPIVKIEDFDSFDDPEAFIDNNMRKKSSSLTNVLDRIQESDFKSAYKANLDANRLQDSEGFSSHKKEFISKLVKDPLKDEAFYEEYLEKENNSRCNSLFKVRQKLPSYNMREKILDLILRNQVVVLSGETGCGKTTQVAQFILDDCMRRKEASQCRIVCTQPRRISAITVAERVADERGERLGRSVGYQIRLEARLPRPQGSILFCTTGIILQWLQSDPLLSGISHLILDEIHERDSQSDFLISIAKDLLPLRPDLKVVLMSATLNAETFSTYYGNCPTIHIPGFTYSVKQHYLEDVLNITKFKYPLKTKGSFVPWKRHKEGADDKEFEDFILPHIRKLESENAYPESVLEQLRNRASEELNLDLVLALLKHIAMQPEGAVLVFVPGWDQISKLHKMIQLDRFFGSSNFLVIPLHSLMPTTNQKEVFNRPPRGVRKIVIATNIAETSITIDDIVYVVDGGRIKMKNYDKETNTSTLLPEWVTLANAKQRKGRAGRVQEGVCYHLFTRARENLLDAFPLPEIQRTRLEEVILQVKILRLGSSSTFLSKVMNPPDESIIDVSIKMLQAINALDSEENLTPLGFHLARLPMDPLTGKMLLMGAIFSCLGPILTVAASLSFKDPFVMVLGKEKLVDKCRLGHAEDTKSDHLMLANVFRKWQDTRGGETNSFIWDNFLSSSILMQLKNMRTQFTDILNDRKFIATRNPDARSVNRNSDNVSLVKAVITAGLYPNVARVLKKPRGKNAGLLRGFSLPDVRKVALHPKSINESERRFEHSWLVYWQKIKTSKVYLYDTTMISNYPLLLFGQKLEYDSKEKVINVDGFVKVRCDKQIADVIQKLRKELDELLEYKISHPGTTDWSEGKEGKLLSLIVQILSKEREPAPQEDFFEDNYRDEDDDAY